MDVSLLRSFSGSRVEGVDEDEILFSNSVLRLHRLAPSLKDASVDVQKKASEEAREDSRLPNFTSRQEHERTANATRFDGEKKSSTTRGNFYHSLEGTQLVKNPGKIRKLSLDPDVMGIDGGIRFAEFDSAHRGLDYTTEKHEKRQYGNMKEAISAIEKSTQTCLAYNIGHGVDDDLSEYVKFVSADESPSVPTEAGSETLTWQVGHIIMGMMKTIENATEVQRDLHSLHNLSFDEESRNIVGKFSICITIQAMNMHLSDGCLLERGLSFLADLCQSNSCNKLQIGQSGIQTIVDCIQSSHTSTSQVSERACNALRTCCSSCPFNQTAAGKAGAIQAILTTMRRRKDCMQLQEQCLHTLLHLTRDHLQNILLLEEYGGCEEIVATCRHYSFDSAFQAAAFNLIQSLLRQCPHLRFSLPTIGVVDDIAATFPLHYTFKPYTVACSTALRYLAFHSRTRRAISNTCIVPTLTCCLCYYRSDESILYPVLLALGNLTYDVPLSKRQACNQRCLTTLQSILSLHATHTTLAEQSLRLLRNISDGAPSTRRLCLRHNMAGYILQAMYTLPGVASLQEHGAATLINLSQVGVQEIRSCLSEQHVRLALSLHSGSKSTQQQLTFLQDMFFPRRKGLARLFSRGTSKMSQESSPRTGTQVEWVLQGETLGHELTEMDSTSSSIEY